MKKRLPDKIHTSIHDKNFQQIRKERNFNLLKGIYKKTTVILSGGRIYVFPQSKQGKMLSHQLYSSTRSPSQ